MNTAMKAAAAGGIAILLLPVLLGAAAIGVLGGQDNAASAAPSDEAIADIPPGYLAHYRHAAQLCPGLDWTVLAAIGKIESNHGRSTLPGVASGANPYSARGPMQIIDPTWRALRRRHPSIGSDVYDPANAIPAASLLLCSEGARDSRDLRAAIFAYNHADWYVRDVLHQAREYRKVEPPRTGATDWEPQQATVPDPTSGGKITPRMHAVLRDIQTYGPSGDSITCVADRPRNPTSDHPTGRACDVMFNPHSKQAVADGWLLAKRLIRTQRITGVKYIIWQGQYWSAENPRWVTYESDAYGCPNPRNLTGCHYDHLHLSVF